MQKSKEIFRHVDCVYLGLDWMLKDRCILLRLDTGKIIFRRTVEFFSEHPFLTRGNQRPPAQTLFLLALKLFEEERLRRLRDKLDAESNRRAGEGGLAG